MPRRRNHPTLLPWGCPHHWRVRHTKRLPAPWPSQHRNYRCDHGDLAFIAVSPVPGMTAETIRADLERTLNTLKQQDPDFNYALVHPIERKFNTWILDHPPMDMPVDAAIVRTLVASDQKITGQEPKSIGLPASELNARYGDDDAHLWEAGIPAPIYGPSGGSYGEDFAYIEEMVLCSQVLALTALAICV